MEASLAHSFATAALVMLLYMIGAYVVALVRQDDDVVYIAWGPGFVLATFAVLWWQDAVSLRQVLATTLVAVWGLWAGFHALLRDWHKPRRFQHHFFRAFFQVFMFRGLLTLAALAPVLYINTYAGRPLGWLDAVGGAVWLAGFIWEMSVKHRFGQAVQVWGLWLVALSVPGGWITVLGPLAVTAFAYRYNYHYHAQGENEGAGIRTA